MNILGVFLAKQGQLCNFSIDETYPGIESELCEGVVSFDLNLFSQYWNINQFKINCDRACDINEYAQTDAAMNFRSISLSAFLSRLDKTDDFEDTYTFSYTHICATGLVNDSKEGPIVAPVGDIEAKYAVFSNWIFDANDDNSSYAFVYVSYEQINFPKRNPKIVDIYIHPGTTIDNLLTTLSTGFRKQRVKYYHFNNDVYSKLSSVIENDKLEEKFKSFKAQIYISGNENSKNFFDFKWFDIFRAAIDNGYKFSLVIYISKFLSNNEITSDDIISLVDTNPQLKPCWWKRAISDIHSIGINERLKRIDLFIKNQIEVLKRYVYETYAYEQSGNKISGRLDITINYCNGDKINLDESVNPTTENALVIDINGCKYISYSNNGYFEYNVCKNEDEISDDIKKITAALAPEKLANKSSQINIEDSKEILKILESSEENTTEKLKKVGEKLRLLKSQKIYLPRWVVYGLPGSGKSTLVKKIADLYRIEKSPNSHISVNDIYVISSDFLINERIFDDDLNSRHNPNNKAPHQDISAITDHVIYSRKDYEEIFLDGGHDMDIRNLAVEIAIKQSAVTHNFPDLGGKEVLIEKTRYLLNDLGYITIFLCPDGDPSMKSIVEPQDDVECINTENYFNAYYEFYRNNHNLFNESKRRNIYELGKPYKYRINANGTEELIIDEKGGVEPQNWENFKEKLRKRIFDPRFYFYNRKYDLKIFRRGSEEEMVCNILKGILKIHIKRLLKER